MRSNLLSARNFCIGLAVVLSCALAGLVVDAQGPAPNPDQAPAVQGGEPVPTGDAGPGRGGGRGRGGAEVLPGGPQANDPAYANYDFSKKAPVPALSPEDELKKLILQPGYRLELVLADPVIAEPTAIAFDGNGR